ncbi:MAG TPA: DoxX family protein [Opitutaceae bacterium]|nr:DoxX family protein [Opitutaceae bacterium]HRJ46535.1 DoxX family protein [Opitutaceae bacterium]
MSTTPTPSKIPFYVSIALAIPPVFMLLLSGVMKVSQNEQVREGFADWPAGSAVAIGVVQLLCTVIYLIPRTAVLGAILLTGYLGGAIAVTVKMGLGFAGWWMPLVFGILLWGALWLRDPRVRALIPLRARG